MNIPLWGVDKGVIPRKGMLLTWLPCLFLLLLTWNSWLEKVGLNSSINIFFKVYNSKHISWSVSTHESRSYCAYPFSKLQWGIFLQYFPMSLNLVFEISMIQPLNWLSIWKRSTFRTFTMFFCTCIYLKGVQKKRAAETLKHSKSKMWRPRKLKFHQYVYLIR